MASELMVSVSSLVVMGTAISPLECNITLIKILFPEAIRCCLQGCI